MVDEIKIFSLDTVIFRFREQIVTEDCAWEGVLMVSPGQSLFSFCPDRLDTTPFRCFTCYEILASQ